MDQMPVSVEIHVPTLLPPTFDGIDVGVHVDPPVRNCRQPLHLRDERDELLVVLVLVPVGLPHVPPAAAPVNGNKQ